MYVAVLRMQKTRLIPTHFTVTVVKVQILDPVNENVMSGIKKSLSKIQYHVFYVCRRQ